MEEALIINVDYYFGDDTYANKVNDVIKVLASAYDYLCDFEITEGYQLYSIILGRKR